MKRISVVVALLLVVAFIAAQAETPSAQAPGITSVYEAKLAEADAAVSLDGSFVRRVGENKFIFRDSTGEVRVAIESGRLDALNLSPNADVHVDGSVDNGIILTEIQAANLSVR